MKLIEEREAVLTKEPWFIYIPKQAANGRRWGWRPYSWQGWAVTFAAIIAAIVVSGQFDINTVQGIGAIVGIAAVFYFIVIQTGTTQP